MKKKRLSKEAWLAAGFRALSQKGPASLRINHLTSELKVTKGSFYWHFEDLKAYKDEMLQLWRSKVATEIIDGLATEPDPSKQLDLLFQSAAMPVPDEFGGRQTEPAMRAWGLSDQDVATALAEIDHQRREFLANLFVQIGLEASPLADLTYAAYIGLDDLQSRGHAEMVPALAKLRALIDLERHSNA